MAAGARRPSGIDLDVINQLLSALGLGGSMSTPATNPRAAMGRSINRRGTKAVAEAGRTAANEASNFLTPYNLEEWSRISRGQAQPSDALWAALYALPATRPIKRARTAYRAGRTALQGEKTPPTTSRQTAGMAGEPSGELQYAGIMSLLRLLGE